MGNNISVNCNINIVSIKTIETASSSYGKMKTREILQDIKELESKEECLKIELITKYSNVNKNIAVIFCNSYDNTRYALGDCAKNDGSLAYKKLTEYGYNVVLYHDSTRERILSVLTQLLELDCDSILVYYIGHGVRTFTSKSKYEASGLDSAFYTLTGLIIDNELKAIIDRKMKNTKIKQFRFISDCCHSGSMYDLTNDDYTNNNMLSIGACNDDETAKQDYICRRGNGIFSYYFWKYYNPQEELQSLMQKINEKLIIYKQQAQTSTDIELTNII